MGPQAGAINLVLDVVNHQVVTLSELNRRSSRDTNQTLSAHDVAACVDGLHRLATED